MLISGQIIPLPLPHALRGCNDIPGGIFLWKTFTHLQDKKCAIPVFVKFCGAVVVNNIRTKQLLNNVNKNCDPHVLRQICSCNQLVICRSAVVLTCFIHNAKYSRHIALETLDVQRR